MFDKVEGNCKCDKSGVNDKEKINADFCIYYSRELLVLKNVDRFCIIYYNLLQKQKQYAYTKSGDTSESLLIIDMNFEAIVRK